MRTVKTLKPGPLSSWSSSGGLGNAKQSALNRGRPAPGSGALRPGVWHCGSTGGRETCSSGCSPLEAGGTR
jgi:hypothetical protein